LRASGTPLGAASGVDDDVRWGFAKASETSPASTSGY